MVCFFTPAAEFKERYASFADNADAHLDEGTMWPTAWALTELTRADEARPATWSGSRELVVTESIFAQQFHGAERARFAVSISDTQMPYVRNGADPRAPRDARP